MSKKHFKRIAAAVRVHLNGLGRTRDREAAERMIVAIANTCYDCNSQFDYDVFYRACGLPVLEVK